jgi:hypothetical protein
LGNRTRRDIRPNPVLRRRHAQGTETVSESSLTAPPEFFDQFNPGATVNLPHRQAEVISVGVADSAGLDLPDHIEVMLT